MSASIIEPLGEIPIPTHPVVWACAWAKMRHASAE